MTDPEVFTEGPKDYVVKFTTDWDSVMTLNEVPEFAFALDKSELQWLVNAGNRELDGDW